MKSIKYNAIILKKDYVTHNNYKYTDDCLKNILDYKKEIPVSIKSNKKGL